MKNKVWLKVLFFQIMFVVITVYLCIVIHIHLTSNGKDLTNAKDSIQMQGVRGEQSGLCDPQTSEENRVLRKMLFQSYADWSKEA
jgi:hypothetical protein